MNEPTLGALFAAGVLLLIGAIAGGYIGFVVGLMWDDWMKKVVRRLATWAVNRWYDWRGAP